MGVYVCDICFRSYKHKKNLTRHTKEKHRNLEHWLCVENGCSSSFSRRSYLSRHLILCHKYDGVTARRAALYAPRGDRPSSGYYEVVSEDDSVLDVIQDLIDEKQDEAILAFDVNVFNEQGNVFYESGNVQDNVQGDAYGAVHGGAQGNVSGGILGYVSYESGNVPANVLGDIQGVDQSDIQNDVHYSNDDVLSLFDDDDMGDVFGDVLKDVHPDVLGDTLGDAFGDIQCNVSDAVQGDVQGDVYDTVQGDVQCNVSVGDQSDAVQGDVLGDGFLSDGSADVQGDDTSMNDVSHGDVVGDVDEGMDVIEISDEEDNICRDIEPYEKTEVTQVVTLTYTRRIKYVNGHKFIKNFETVVHTEEY